MSIENVYYPFSTTCYIRKKNKICQSKSVKLHLFDLERSYISQGGQVAYLIRTDMLFYNS